MNETLMTTAGLDRLREELDTLTTQGRQEIAVRIRRATEAEANAIESADYQDAREEQALLERRIALLRHRISTATIVEPDSRNGIVDVGERVRLRDLATDETIEYELVGAVEADPFARRISAASPLGRALHGRRRGDVVDVEAPKGLLRYEIVGIRATRRPRLAAR